MIQTVVIGAAGRMGRRLVANIMESPTLALSGATEYAGSPFLGQDAGLVAGCGEAKVKITADLDKALEGADAVINFATSGVIETTRAAVAKGCAVVIGTTALKPEEKAELVRCFIKKAIPEQIRSPHWQLNCALTANTVFPSNTRRKISGMCRWQLPDCFVFNSHSGKNSSEEVTIIKK